MLKRVIVVFIPVDIGTDSGDSISWRGNHESRAEYSLSKIIFDMCVYLTHLIIEYRRLSVHSISHMKLLNLTIPFILQRYCLFFLSKIN